MATGKIKKWHNDRGFGFVADDAGGGDAFLHIGKVQQSDQQYLQEGVAVTFEKLPSEKHSGKFDAHNVRLQGSPSPKPAPPSSKSDDYFHNPYTFVPSPPRQDAIKSGGFAGEFDPLKCGLNHASLQKDLWTGHLPIKLTTVTPLVLPKTEGEERSPIEHQTYDMLDHLPESSLRGMLRSAYEVVTNSRYGCFRNDDRLAYRMRPQEALKLIPAIIENGNGAGELVARLCPGTSNPTVGGPKKLKNGSDQDRAMYAAMLTLYGNRQQQSQCMNGYTPKTGDEVWSEIVLCNHRRGYLYWKASRIWPKIKHTRPSLGTIPKGWSHKSLYKDPKTEKPLVQVVEGRVLITNENMGNKHDERIFFNPSTTHDVTSDLKKAWRMRIKSYREAHSESDIFQNQPWEKIGNTPGETAWSPHLYQDGKNRDRDRWGRNVHDAIDLKPGDMVYARCKFDKKGSIEGIEDLFPVMISRELYDDSPADLLDISLKPAASRCKSSPADRLFGWVLLRKSDQNQESEGGYKGRIRVVCEDGTRPEIIQDFGGKTLPLAILGQPKPAQGRFYVAEDAKGTPQNDGINKEQAGYNKDKGLRGRKQYWHHKGLEADKAQNYWNPSAEDRTQQKRNGRYQEYRRPDKGGNPQTDSQNRSITGWIKPGTVFKVSLYVQNLQPEEVGALLWLLSLPKDRYFKLGYGKPLGFGSVRMEIDEERCVSGCLPLGTGEDWKDYYAAFDASPPATLDKDRRNNCIEKFKTGMVAAYNPPPARDETDEGREDQKTSPQRLTSFADLKHIPLKTIPEDREQLAAQRFNDLPFISGFLQVLTGPQKDAPIHYPRRDCKPNPEGKNFEWFVDNEKGAKVVLPAVTDAKGLPYKPRRT